MWEVWLAAALYAFGVRERLQGRMERAGCKARSMTRWPPPRPRPGGQADKRAALHWFHTGTTPEADTVGVQTATWPTARACAERKLHCLRAMHCRPLQRPSRCVTLRQKR